MTLCMLAHFFLVRQTVRLKKSAGPDGAPSGGCAQNHGPATQTGLRLIKGLIAYRAKRNGAATRSHRRRRGQPP